jgi:isoquinoline 1-oxidoreductase subunit beta
MPPVSRRFMLRGAVLAAASLLVPVAARRADAGGRKGESGYEITDWIVIASSGQVTLGLSQPAVGQGSHTALPQILAEES